MDYKIQTTNAKSTVRAAEDVCPRKLHLEIGIMPIVALSPGKSMDYHALPRVVQEEDVFRVRAMKLWLHL